MEVGFDDGLSAVLEMNTLERLVGASNMDCVYWMSYAPYLILGQSFEVIGNQAESNFLIGLDDYRNYHQRLL